MRSVYLLILLTILPALAGCARTVIVSEPVFGQNYTVDDFDYASRNGDLITRVGADPFGGPQDDFAYRVTNHMYGANVGGDVRFTPLSRGRGGRRYLVVMRFNPPIGADEADFCFPNRKVPTLPLGRTLRLAAAFCYKNTLLSTATGRVSHVRDGQSPLFRKLVRQVTLSLFPSFDDLNIGDDGGSLFN